MLHMTPYSYSPDFCKLILKELRNNTTDSYVYNNAYIRGILKIFGFHETSEIMKGTLNFHWEKLRAITAVRIEAELELQRIKSERIQ